MLPLPQAGGPSAADAPIDVNDEFRHLFDSPVGDSAALPDGAEVEDLDENFLPLSQKVSLSPLPEESIAASASELLFSELTEKTKLLELARKEAQQYKLKCQALMTASSAAKKRQRDPVPPLASAAAVEPDEAPKKKPSPEGAKAPCKPEASKQSLSDSDDEVPPPEPPPLRSEQPSAGPGKVRLFEQLNSVLCAYKDKTIRPGSQELPFDICTELCKEEAQTVAAWNPSTCKRFHEAVVSALRLVYPHKRDSWFESPFLLSPTGAAKYWSRVLSRRADIWRTAATKAKALHRESLQQKIRRKIDERRQSRIKSLSKSAAVAANDPFKTPVKSLRSVLSSDSDDETNNVIDLSQSPLEAASKSAGAAAAVPSPKMAPAPK